SLKLRRTAEALGGGWSASQATPERSAGGKPDAARELMSRRAKAESLSSIAWEASCDLASRGVKSILKDLDNRTAGAQTDRNHVETARAVREPVVGNVPEGQPHNTPALRGPNRFRRLAEHKVPA